MPERKSRLTEVLENADTEQEATAAISWSDADSADLLDFVAYTVDMGGLVSFSKTRDGSALVLAVLDEGLDKGSIKKYLGSKQQIYNTIRDFAEGLREA